MDLTIKPKTLKLPKENIEGALSDFKLGKDFFDSIPKA